MRTDPKRRLAETYPFELTLDTRFGDMDPNRHLNNTAISRLYEETRVRFHMMVRSTYGEVGHPRFLVGHIAIDYLGEGHYPEPVVARLGVTHVGTSSYRLALGLFQQDQCIGLQDAVMVHRNETGVAPIPDVLRQTFDIYRLRG